MLTKHIKNLDRRKTNTSKISVHIYDKDLKMNIFIFRIDTNNDSCMLICDSVSSIGYAEMHIFPVSELDEYFNNCVILKDSSCIGIHYKKLLKIIEN